MNFGERTKPWILVLLLFVCLIAVNVLVFLLPAARLDITEDRLFTISEGSREILQDLKDPLLVKLYFSRSSEELPNSFKTYGQRVEDLLGEYEALSGGRLELQIFDPKPDSEEEEWAQKYGIEAVTLPSGNAVYFGIAMQMLDRETALPFLDPRRQEFLEYDLTQSIYQVSQVNKPKVGILSSMDLAGGPALMPGQPPGEKWAFLSELEKFQDVRMLQTNLTEVPEDISLLLVVHPKEFSDSLQYALDQYVMRGGRLVLLLDPSARSDLASPMNRMSQQPNLTSDLPQLREAWGIAFDSSKIVGDFQYATPVNTNSGVMRFPFWMSIRSNALSADHPLTSELESLLFIEAGSLGKLDNYSVEMTPLLSASPDSGMMDAFMTRFMQPQQMVRELKTSPEPKALVALYTGKLSSAFPEGPPAPKQTDDSTPPPSYSKPHLKETAESNTILVFSDVDFLSDDYSVQKLNFLGQTLVQPTNDNLNLGLGAVEYFSGNDALQGIRSRGRFQRPFTRLIALQQDAQVRYQAEEMQLQQSLEEVQRRLEQLLQGAGKEGQKEILLPPEIQDEIKQFREEERQTRRKLREVRKILRQDIEQLGNRLLVLNLVAVPLLVGIFGLFIYRNRVRGR